MAALADGGITKTGRILAREVAGAAPQVDDALLAFAGGAKHQHRGAEGAAAPVLSQIGDLAVH